MYRYLLIFLILVSGPAFSACSVIPTIAGGPTITCGSATRYDVEVQSVSLCTESTCASPVSIGSTSKTFDIASASVGSAIGSYANFDAVTPGTYTHVKTVVSSTMTLTGSALATCGAVDAAQKTIPNTVTFPSNSMSLDWVTGSTSSLKMIIALSAPIVVSRTSSMPSISVKFGTSNALMCVGGVGSFPAPPDVSITVQ